MCAAACLSKEEMGDWVPKRIISNFSPSKKFQSLSKQTWISVSNKDRIDFYGCQAEEASHAKYGKPR